MTWDKTPQDRQRDAQVYGTEYRKARDQARRRAGGFCEQCRHRHPRLQCDHIIPASQGGGHSLSNLRMLCAGPNSCKCHERKTATEGGGRRSGKRRTDPAPQPRERWYRDPPAQPRTRW